ncbi:unnamed protein product [Miscanthus lutarioriparius]|uniref:Uncharacterized protein n=1 Tax=Miscanthus lutarioriparius TaxID=422564 RepID=A0A811RUL3_9POAL|nr:unnamed protein product [Miscanthus lutarioriparius]
MPKIKTSRVKYPEGWELIEPTLRDLEAKMREAENDPHDGKRKCEALWPIFRISHQKSRYIYDLYYRRKEISKELYEFCLDQGYADRNLIAKWKKVGSGSFTVTIFGFYYSILWIATNDYSLESFCSQVMSASAAFAAYRHETTTSQPLASAECLSTSGRRR